MLDRGNGRTAKGIWYTAGLHWNPFQGGRDALNVKESGEQRGVSAVRVPLCVRSGLRGGKGREGEGGEAQVIREGSGTEDGKLMPPTQVSPVVALRILPECWATEEATSRQQKQWVYGRRQVHCLGIGQGSDEETAGAAV
eukprot:GGOE01058149.1.p1 GENE.GGOE01058149.1~~GGOE01058149.1.p1  ORF type:complete len:140 (-),score=0.76 GGOE01058149.1:311-730(-)